MNAEEAEKLVEAFAAANRAVAWAEAGGDEAEAEDVEAQEQARSALINALTREGVHDEYRVVPCARSSVPAGA